MTHTRRTFLNSLAAGAALTLLNPLPKKVGGATKRPNILFIMADDHPAHAVSAYGSKINKTPNIDRIAQEGMRFDNCFCTNAICTPSRAVILTGKYSHLNGSPTLDGTFDGSQQTFPKLLQEAGYDTSVVGKWHLESQPTGFDYYCVLPGQGLYFDPLFKETGAPWENGVDGGKPFQGYVTDVTADIVLDVLKNKRDEDKPFFIAYHEKSPHDLWDYDEKHAHLYEDVDVPEPENLLDDYANRGTAMKTQDFFRIGPVELEYGEEIDKLSGDERVRAQYQVMIKRFLRCVASIDDNVGRVLDYLDESGLAENTIVIYTADQGAFLGEHGFWDKRFMYEESLRMPFLVRHPGEIEGGSVNKDMILNLDFAETFLDLAEAPVPSDMQGESIKPLLEGKSPADWRTTMYYRYSAPGIPPQHCGVRSDRYKLIYFYGLANLENDVDGGFLEPEWELYDLEKDPKEMNNVYGNAAYADVEKEMKAELRRLQKAFKDPEPEIPA